MLQETNLENKDIGEFYKTNRLQLILGIQNGEINKQQKYIFQRHQGITQ